MVFFRITPERHIMPFKGGEQALLTRGWEMIHVAGLITARQRP
jgi:hypothetical protein